VNLLQRFFPLVRSKDPIRARMQSIVFRYSLIATGLTFVHVTVSLLHPSGSFSVIVLFMLIPIFIMNAWMVRRGWRDATAHLTGGFILAACGFAVLINHAIVTPGLAVMFAICAAYVFLQSPSPVGMWIPLASGTMLLARAFEDAGVTDPAVHPFPLSQGTGAALALILLGLLMVAIRRSFDDAWKEREGLYRHVIRMQRLDAVGKMASGIVHDFNNILMVIQGSAELAVLEKTGSAMRKHLNAIRKGAVRGLGLTKRLLSFSRGATVDRAVIDGGHILRDFAPVLRRTLPGDVRLDIVVQESAWPIAISQTELEQLVLNLVVNAKDAITSEGVIAVGLTNVPDSQLISLAKTLGKDTSFVLLTVRDTGSGIPPEVEAHMFDALFTTKEAGKGTGLGLATCLAIATARNGFIDYTTAQGQGTEFRVYLPVPKEGVPARSS